jgi:MtN3 and saliva related transmembrane protein
MDLTTIIGVAASIFTAGALIPQLIKLLREKKAEDISLMMLGVMFTGVALWTGYGFLKEDWIIIVSNAFSLVINVAITFFTIKYRA